MENDVFAQVFWQIFFLIAGTILVGLGSNFYLAFGLAFLLIYNKTKE